MDCFLIERDTEVERQRKKERESLLSCGYSSKCKFSQNEILACGKS